MSRRAFFHGFVATLSVPLTIDTAISLSRVIRPRGVVFHHSALSPSTPLESLKSLHKRKGLSTFYWFRSYDIGYHYVITAGGDLVSTRPETLRGAHARGANNMIGICVEGNFDGSAGDNKPSQKQLDTLMKLSRALVKKYQFQSVDFWRHSDINPNTVCPGSNFPFDAFKETLFLAGE